MAVESKIRELLKGKPEMVTEEVNELDEGAASRPADKSEGDSSAPAQGSSEANPSVEVLSTDNVEGNPGSAATAKASKDGSKSASASVSGDQTSPTQGSSKTGIKAEDTESDDEVLEEEIKA